MITNADPEGEFAKRSDECVVAPVTATLGEYSAAFEHAEYDPYASDLFVSRLQCSPRARGEMRLSRSRLARLAIYVGTNASEPYYCDFGISPSRVVGCDGEGAVPVVELPQYPFFVGTLYVPQAKLRPSAPHRCYRRFIRRRR